MEFRTSRRGLLALAAGLPLARPARARPALAQTPAQTWPSRVIKLVVPFSAGGQPDVIARLFVQHLSTTVGTTIVDNRPGANTTIGTTAVAQADPDGHTLLYGSATSLALAPALAKVAYDPIASFAPIAGFSTSPFILVVGPSLPVKTVAELIAYAKGHPGKLNFAAPQGGPPHLAGELFKRAVGIDIMPVAYRTMNQAFTDLLAGQMDIVFDGPAPLMGLIAENKVRGLVSLSARRIKALPEVPTMAESGLPNVQLTTWNGLVAPAGTPQPIITRLNASINDALKSPEILAALDKFASEPLVLSPQEFADLIKVESRKWADIVKESGFKQEGQ
jgi:tripartite-type tricarboxylate transporter receptor subunit TctC